MTASLALDPWHRILTKVVSSLCVATYLVMNVGTRSCLAFAIFRNTDFPIWRARSSILKIITIVSHYVRLQNMAGFAIALPYHSAVVCTLNKFLDIISLRLCSTTVVQAQINESVTTLRSILYHTGILRVTAYTILQVNLLLSFEFISEHALYMAYIISILQW